jgi:hypothetical protein
MQSGKLLRVKFDPPRNLRLPLAGNPQVNLSCQPVALVRQRRTRTAYAVLLVEYARAEYVRANTEYY